MLELADFTHAVRNEPKTAGLIRLATALGAVACASGIALMFTPLFRPGLALFAFGALCFALHNAPEHIAARWFARTPSAARSLKYTLSPDGLIVSSQVSQSRYRWPSLFGFYRTERALLVWVSQNTFLILPERAFSEADLPKVVERLERELGGPPPAPRLGAYLSVTFVLAALALWLWNRLSPR